MNDILFFDLETTGTDVVKDRIVQIAIFYTNQDGETEVCKSVLVNPGMPIPKEASDVHGITDDKVSGAVSFKSISKSVYEIFQKAKNWSGFNIKRFDVPLLVEEFLRCGIDVDFSDKKIFDSYEIHRKLNPSTLSDVYRLHTGEELEGAHDAINDVLASREVLFSQMDEAKFEEIEIHEDSKFLDYAGKIVLIDGVACWAFGKNKNHPLVNDLPYARWFLSSDFPLYSKSIVKKIIENV